MLKLLRSASPFVAALAAPLLLSASAAAQQLPLPQASPAATVTQTVGLTQVTVDYHRPSVKGRKVWGEVVPFGEVWRAGANENTVVKLAGDVKVEGKDLPAGTYGLHMIPTASTWTVIFSHNSTSWGSYSYDEKEDALRVTVTPVKAPACESLAYEFGDITEDGATLSLRWENLAVPLHLAVDTQGAVLEAARASLAGASPSDWKTPNAAAAYCLRKQVNLKEALDWSEASLAIAQNFTNMNVNAGLLEALGRKAEAEPMHKEALAVATEQELFVAASELAQSKQLPKALELLKASVAAHPESFSLHDSLAEASALSGDKPGAIEHYKKALQLAKDAESKTRIEGALKKLGAL